MEQILRTNGYKVETMEDLMNVAPASFSGDHNRSKNYSFVSTTSIIENLAKLGWNITYAKQQGSSKFSRHIIRLTSPELGYMDLKNDKIRPQLILDNSHNGGSSAQLHMGLFRMVCESEMVISSPSLFTNIKFRHMGLNFDELKGVMEKMAEQYKVVAKVIADMQDIVLTEQQQLEFAAKGAAYRDPRRYINDDGTINYKNLNEAIDPKVLLDPVRGGDKPRTLWETFQNVREWLIKGGFEQKSEKSRKSRSKAINNAVRQISLNKTLWVMAEDYLTKPVENEVFNTLMAAAANAGITTESDIKTFTSTKGEKRQVMIMSDLGDGRTQVRDIHSKLIFCAANDRLS